MQHFLCTSCHLTFSTGGFISASASQSMHYATCNQCGNVHLVQPKGDEVHVVKAQPEPMTVAEVCALGNPHIMNAMCLARKELVELKAEEKPAEEPECFYCDSKGTLLFECEENDSLCPRCKQHTVVFVHSSIS